MNVVLSFAVILSAAAFVILSAAKDLHLPYPTG